MNRKLKIIFAAAAIVALGAGWAADHNLNPGLTIVPIAKEAVDEKENSNGTLMYVYGRSVSGTQQEVDAFGTPDGMIWWTGHGGWDGTMADNTSLFLSQTELSESEAASKGLIALGGINIPYFYVSEQIEGSEYPFTYIRAGLNGPGTVKFPVCWDEAEIYVMQNPRTKEKRVVSYQVAEEMIAGKYGIDGDKWEYKGPCDRNTAIKEGVSIGNPSHDPARNEISGEYYGRLEAAYADQSPTPSH